MIPQEIPRRLRTAAIVPEFAGEDEGVWTRDGAIEVLAALEWTKIAVVGAQGCVELAGRLVPIDAAWSFHGTVGETESTRARRSHAAAAHFIAGLGESVPYVLLEFSYQDDAA